MTFSKVEIIRDVFFLTSYKVMGEVPEVVKTGIWVGDCFIYTSSINRLNCYVGGEIITIAHMDRYNSLVNVNLVNICHQSHLGLFIFYLSLAAA